MINEVCRNQVPASQSRPAEAAGPVDPKDISYVVIGAGDVTTSGPMGMALKYLAQRPDLVAPGSVKIVAGPALHGPADTQAAFMKRIQTGREPLSPAQLAGYETMTGIHPDASATLPACDVTNQQQLIDTLTPLIGQSKRAVVYLGLPPFTFPKAVDGLAALQAKLPNVHIVVADEKPFGKNTAAAEELANKTGVQQLSIDHFLAYPGNLAAKKLLSQPFFHGAISNQYVDRGRFRMDEGPPFVGADRPYMRGLGQDGTHNHGGVAEDMFQSHG
ncbi:MAG: hypothetical protein ACYCW6_14400, partial [Candidatus Xenobia bacterium]